MVNCDLIEFRLCTPPLLHSYGGFTLGVCSKGVIELFKACAKTVRCKFSWTLFQWELSFDFLMINLCKDDNLCKVLPVHSCFSDIDPFRRSVGEAEVKADVLTIWTWVNWSICFSCFALFLLLVQYTFQGGLFALGLLYCVQLTRKIAYWYFCHGLLVHYGVGFIS